MPHRQQLTDLFEARRRASRRYLTIISILVGIGFIVSITWAVLVYQDCRSAGNRLYQCAALMQNPHYTTHDSRTYHQ